MKRKSFLTARMHESGHYFFCPFCSLSFPHPPHVESFYLVGHGFCWYCVRHVPLEGGDREGIAAMDESGQVYLTVYNLDGGQKRMTVAECIRAHHRRRSQSIFRTAPLRYEFSFRAIGFCREFD